ncbi:MAG TPA: DedA family protein [Spirochaetota bacterium]|nr:DedA family protein [Spirochaetota bacterium]HNT09378.1 DedA family protein [Spirochaetota bacterium]HNV48762.1 DedA family protein [Spirochaetota bacterium]HOS39315.1 DedA family protein [Spirochaetota bacterium]HPU89263.1 DedA family protein [Spirochaetota bacterium]
MEDFANRLIEYFGKAPDAALYLFLFASSVVENIFPPIPGDTITAFGAFLVGTGRLNYGLVFAVTTVGSVVGFMTLFALGRYLERHFFIERDYTYFSAKSIIAAEEWFRRRGNLVVLGNRFLPGVRSVISIVAGISMLNPLTVLLLSTVSAAVWNLIWIHAGYMLGDRWEIVREKVGALMRSYNIVAAIVIVIAIIAVILYRWRKRPPEA